MWNDNDKIMEVIDELNKGSANFPCMCPVCNNNSAHIYIHNQGNKHCGIWTWCSHCGATSHMSGITPEWWKNPSFIDSTQLCSDPEYLEQMKEEIDTWANSIAPREAPSSEKPFIMEQKFNVIFKENFQDIVAGTRGVLVIKDDFKNIKINFISSDGKAISIKEAPDKLIKTVEVIKP